MSAALQCSEALIFEEEHNFTLEVTLEDDLSSVRVNEREYARECLGQVFAKGFEIAVDLSYDSQLLRSSLSSPIRVDGQRA